MRKSNTVAMEPFGFYLSSYFSFNLHVGGLTYMIHTQIIFQIIVLILVTSYTYLKFEKHHNFQ